MNKEIINKFVKDIEEPIEEIKYYIKQETQFSKFVNEQPVEIGIEHIKELINEIEILKCRNMIEQMKKENKSEKYEKIFSKFIERNLECEAAYDKICADRCEECTEPNKEIDIEHYKKLKYTLQKMIKNIKWFIKKHNIKISEKLIKDIKEMKVKK